jgi:putrescine transport system ATP-binding protein
LREHTQFELINIQKALGVTFIVVTHDQEEAMTLSTRMGVMNHGRIVQVGTPAQIYESPGTRFIADFIGSVNMFEGKVLGEPEARQRIRCPELGCVIRVDRQLPVARDATVWAAVRPEKISMTRTPPAGLAEVNPDTENVVRGVVRGIAYMGDASVYLVALDSGREVRVTLPNSARDPEQRIGQEEVVFLSWQTGSPVVLTE